MWVVCIQRYIYNYDIFTHTSWLLIFVFAFCDRVCMHIHAYTYINARKSDNNLITRSLLAHNLSLFDRIKLERTEEEFWKVSALVHLLHKVTVNGTFQNFCLSVDERDWRRGAAGGGGATADGSLGVQEGIARGRRAQVEDRTLAAAASARRQKPQQQKKQQPRIAPLPHSS